MNDYAAVCQFETRADFRRWLEQNHSTSAGIWVVFIKGSKAFTANNALEEALCFGWIDSTVKPIDDKTYKKYFAKRKSKTKWSEKNKGLFKKLQESGLMTPAGVEVYQPDEETDVPKSASPNHSLNIETLRAALADDPELLQLFEQTRPSRQKQLAGFYCDAKTEKTRKKRLGKIADALRSRYQGMLY